MRSLWRIRTRPSGTTKSRILEELAGKWRFVHLAVHGVLHLAGHDHIRPKDAKAMEALEVKILARFGIADPYAIMPQ